MVYLAVAYLIFWKTFFINMESDLWKNKSVLSVLSPQIILAIDAIKNFIVKNSSTLLFTKLNNE